MKINSESKKFTPVTITLETQEEVNLYYAIFGALSYGTLGRAGVEWSETAKLFNFLRGLRTETHTLKAIVFEGGE